MSFFEKLKGLLNFNEEDYFNKNRAEYEEDDDYDMPEEEDKFDFERKNSPKPDKGNTNLVPFSGTGKTEKARIYVAEPHSFEDCAVPATALVQKNIVLLNLEKNRDDESKRILDFFSGVSFAVEAEPVQIGTRIFLIKPKNVEITNEMLQELKENS